MSKRNNRDFFTLLRKTLRIALSHIYQRRYLLIVKRDIVPLDKEKAKEQLAGAKIFEIHTDEELVTYFTPLLPQKIPLFRERMRDPALHCYVVVDADNKLIGYTWLAHDSYYERELKYTISLAQDQVYSFDGFLLPLHRKGLMPIALGTQSMAESLKKGKKEGICLVDESNKRSMFFHHRWNCKETMRCLHVTKIFTRPVHAKLVEYTEPRMTREKMLKRKK